MIAAISRHATEKRLPMTTAGSPLRLYFDFSLDASGTSTRPAGASGFPDRLNDYIDIRTVVQDFIDRFVATN